MTNIHYLTAFEFEAGALQQAARIAQAPGMTRPLVVTDPGLAASELLPRPRAHLGAQAGAEFTGTPLNLDEQAVDTATRLYRDGGCDGVLAIPTTAGTGSEVGRDALISLGDGRKLGLITPHLVPRAALCATLTSRSACRRG